jgi:hypothetical protein
MMERTPPKARLANSLEGQPGSTFLEPAHTQIAADKRRASGCAASAAETCPWPKFPRE